MAKSISNKLSSVEQSSYVRFVGPVPEGKRLWHTQVLPASVPGERGARAYLADDTVELAECTCGWHGEVGPHYVLPWVAEAHRAEAGEMGYNMEEFHAWRRHDFRMSELANKEGKALEGVTWAEDRWSSLLDMTVLFPEDLKEFKKVHGVRKKIDAETLVCEMWLDELADALLDARLLNVTCPDQAELVTTLKEWGYFDDSDLARVLA